MSHVGCILLEFLVKLIISAFYLFEFFKLSFMGGASFLSAMMIAAL